MDKKLTFRRADKNDIPRLLEILSQVLEVHAKIRPDLFVPGTTKYSAQDLEPMVVDDQNPIYVAVNEEGVVAGYTFCQLQEPPFTSTMIPRKSLFIDDFCVDEVFRGQHVGEQLFEYVKQEAVRLGCYEVTLNVWAGNDGAERFYERMGLTTKERMMELILDK